jgi:hypothetical protein
MSIQFTEENHLYTSLDPKEKIEWTSVTGLTKLFKPEFDTDTVAKKCAANKKYKLYGKTEDEIKAIWAAESKRSTDLGTWYHNQREEQLLMHDTLTREGIALPIIAPKMDGNVKIASSQSLAPGIYPEHMIYLKSAGICGQADRVEVIGDRIDLYDYKTNKEIRTKGFTNWQGVTSKLLHVCSHLDDCHLNHYALQLSVYMYMMLKHNHFLNPGKMEIHHVVFEIAKEDENGYPIAALGTDGEPIVKEVVPYELPYLKEEVVHMIQHHNKLKADANE